MTRRSWSIAAITIAVLILAYYTHEIISRVPAYGWLHSHRPFYVAESIDKIGGAAVCLLAVWLMYTRYQPRAWAFCARFTRNRIRADRFFAEADRLCDYAKPDPAH